MGKCSRTGKDPGAAFRACGSATFREFARSAPIYATRQDTIAFPQSIDLDERFDLALRWHEHCSKRGLTAPQCTVSSPSRRKEEESMMSTHGCAASASVDGHRAREDCRSCHPCFRDWSQPHDGRHWHCAGSTGRRAAARRLLRGSVYGNAEEDQRQRRNPHRLSREFPALRVPRRAAKAARLLARPLRNRRRGDRGGARQRHPGRSGGR